MNGWTEGGREGLGRIATDGSGNLIAGGMGGMVDFGVLFECVLP